MIRSKHQEDLTNGKEGDNGLEAMTLPFGVPEVCITYQISIPHYRNPFSVIFTNSCIPNDGKHAFGKQHTCKLAFEEHLSILI